MGKHKIEVIQVGPLVAHPNADTLDLVQVYGYTCAVKRGEFKEGDLAVYIEPDFIVPDEPEYAFLGSNRRIKARRLRGVWSQGLLIHAPTGSRLGEDVIDLLGIVRWIPPADRGEPNGAMPSTHKAFKWYRLSTWRRAYKEMVRWLTAWRIVKKWEGTRKEEAHPSLQDYRVYDLENWRKGSSLAVYGYRSIIPEGTPVIITEKIHGTNARYAWREGKMYCGSRQMWREYEPSSWWWQALEQNAWIAEWCIRNQDCILFGEVYNVQKGFQYGLPEGRLGFKVFDVREKDGSYRDAVSVLRDFEMEGRHVPVIKLGEYNKDAVDTLAEGKTMIGGGHMREGIVIKPAQEMHHVSLGRVALKLVSNAYLERAED